MPLLSWDAHERIVPDFSSEDLLNSIPESPFKIEAYANDEKGSEQRDAELEDVGVKVHEKSSETDYVHDEGNPRQVAHAEAHMSLPAHLTETTGGEYV